MSLACSPHCCLLSVCCLPLVHFFGQQPLSLSRPLLPSRESCAMSFPFHSPVFSALGQLHLNSLLCLGEKKNPPLLLNRSQPSPSLLLRAAHAQSSHIPLLPPPTDTLHRTLGSWDIRDSAPIISTHLLSRVPSDP